MLVFFSTLQMTTGLKDKLKESIRINYAEEMTIRTDSHKRLVVDAWDSLQRKVIINSHK